METSHHPVQLGVPQLFNHKDPSSAVSKVWPPISLSLEIRRVGELIWNKSGERFDVTVCGGAGDGACR